MRLSAAALHALPAPVARPEYDRDRHGIGIVHFGIGAFHRAHMAIYTDDALAATGGDWRILGVSLRSPSVRDQMRPQNGLYTLVEQSAAGSRARIAGSVADVLVAMEERERLVATLAAPTTHIVSFTITEKGYCRGPDGGLDPLLADSNSVYAYLAEAFARRRDAGLNGLTLLSCDNLSGNGAQLHRLMAEYLDRHAPDALAWFLAECTCPSTMIDRIVPATTAADKIQVENLIGLRDEAAVISEPFSQWVIEDRFAGPRPCWDRHGVQFAADIAPFETAKLRMLNGAHSALAYLGLQRGHDYVHQAIADAELYPLIDRLMREEAATSLTPSADQDLASYADRLVERFGNPALQHRLIQIAMDGSQKLPQRWLETLAFHADNGRRCIAIEAAIHAWIDHIGNGRNPLDDPLAEQLRELVTPGDPRKSMTALFGTQGLLPGRWSAGIAQIAGKSAAISSS